MRPVQSGEVSLQALVFGCLVPMLALQSMAQDASVPTAFVPPSLQAQAAASGRFTNAASGRMLLTGTITTSDGSVPISLGYEVGGKFRYHTSSYTLVVNSTGAKDTGSSPKSKGEIAESLFDDSPDGILWGSQRARMLRVLMYRARMDDGKSPDYKGPYVDIYDIVRPVLTRQDEIRQKHCYFDSQTQLLDRVVYTIGGEGGKRIETRFGGWKSVNGVPVPGSITRSEDGATVFTFALAEAQLGPAAQDGLFQQP